MKTVLIFDVNETLLDVGALAPDFERFFGDAHALPTWFAQLLQSAFAITMSGAYHDFSACGRHALQIVANKYGREVDHAAAEAILSQFLELPPHPDVPDGLSRLRDAGFRLATLTNSAPVALASQLRNAGLAGYFEKTLSVDAVGKFKPHPATYQMAAKELGAPLNHLRLIAAHNWDTTGAIRAGCRAAFVARPGMFLGPLDEQPDIKGANLTKVVDQILLVDQPD